MFTVIAGTVLLAIVHALIPNHWLPLVAVARAEQWEQKEVTTITLLAALAHVTGTIALGIVLGLIGKELTEEYGRIIYVISSLLLIVFGLIYFTVNLPHHHPAEHTDIAAYRRSKRRWVLIFIVMMFLSPCLEVESVFLSAGVFGMGIVILLALIYAIVSVLGILFLVSVGYKGINLIPSSFIEHNEKRISGIILILVGIGSFFLH